MTVRTGNAAGAVRRALRTVVCPVVLGVFAVLAAPVPTAVAAVDPVRVTVSSLSPALPGPDDTMTLTGALTNATDRQITGSHLGVRVDDGGDVAGRTEPVAPLSPGESVPFTVRVPVTALDLGEAGDHTLGVALTGGDDVLLGLTRTHLVWSPPDTDGKPLNVAVIWPVTDAPHMEAVSLGAGGSARPVFRDDGLAQEFDRGGRLRRIVEAAAGLPVTWTVDPGLLDEAKGMTDGYRVADIPDGGDPQRSREGNGEAPASAWLAALRSAVKGGTVAALPYADPDLAALAHVGARSGALDTVLRQSVRWGGTAATSVLGVPVRDDVAWPYGGALDGGIAGLARTLGPTTLLASGQGLSTGTTQPRVSLGDGTTALVGDPAIGTALSRQLSGGDDVLAARQEILGALLSAQQRTSDDTDGLIVVPPRQMSGLTAQALADALTLARSAGWVKLAGLDDVAEGPADPPSARVAPAIGGSAGTGAGTGVGAVTGPATGRATGLKSGSAAGSDMGWATGPDARLDRRPDSGRGEAGATGRASGRSSERAFGQVAGRIPGRSGEEGPGRGESYPQALRAGELSADDLTAVAAIQPDLGTLGQVLSDPGRTTDAVHRAMLRAVSTGWRVEAASGDADDRKSYTGGVRAYVDNSITSVHLLPKHGTVTMAGDSASIPVTVANGLQQRLGGLELRVTSSAPNRVSVDNPETAVRAPAAANHTGQVRVSAHANGPVEITAQLYTIANGRPWGAPTTFRVKVSRISPLVVVVIAAGVLLVLLAGAFQMRRTARRRNAGKADGSPTAEPGLPTR